MKTVIRKWGNSLAIRIPHAFAMHMKIDSGKEVELSLEPNGLLIESAQQDLDSLLSKVTHQNIHREEFVQTTGIEIW